MQEAILGIIAEYNPFHNGHLYHMNKAKEMTHASCTVIALSSNFVQRGEPSMIDKWERTRMALAQGANLVIEMPSAFSCHNAGVFCSAGVDLLAATETVTHLSFGMEDTSFHSLKGVIDILIEEPPSFKENLKRHLQEGHSYVESRSLALEDLIPGAGRLMSSSNNILAVGYMMRITQKGYPLTPVPVERTGRAYLDDTLTDVASATAIRKAIKEKGLDEVYSYVPQESFFILKKAFDRGRCAIDDDVLFRMIIASCLRASPKELASYAEMKEGIENRIMQASKYSKDLQELIEAISTKRYPKARVQRHLMHILLAYDHWTNKAVQRLSVPYIRVLGFDDKGRALLKTMRKKARLPLITKTGSLESPYSKTIAAFEYKAVELWEMLCNTPQRRKDVVQKPITV